MANRHTKNVLLVFCTGVMLLATLPASAADWGSIKGRFVIDGAPPQVAPLVVSKDAFCIQTKPKNESVVVGEGGALANAVVFLRVPRGKKVESHPDFAAQLKETVVLDNKGCAFVPHITVVRVGQPFAIKNSDPAPVSHNTNAQLTQNSPFNVIIPVGEERKMTLSKPENLPMPVNCNIHPFMVGHVLVQDHPYMAVSGEDGSFEIKNVPVGKHEFQLWHEAAGYLKGVKFTGGPANRQGRVNLTVAAGKTLDLGDIKVPVSVLK